MERRRVYKSAYRTMTVAGVDRRLFMLALLAGAVVFNIFSTLRGGIIVALALYAVARWAHRTDQKFVDILIAARRHRVAYCAAKRADAPEEKPW